MPWINNKYIFPRAAPAYATLPPPPAPPEAATPPAPAIPQRWKRPEPIDGDDVPDPDFGATRGPTAPDPAPPLDFTGYAPVMSLLGGSGGLLGGIPGVGVGLGLLGAYTDVSRAEEALAEEYGAHPPGYGRVSYNPDLSTWGAFLDAVTGIFGESAVEQIAAEMRHMGVADLEGIGYQTAAPQTVEATAAMEDAYGGPSATEMAAAMEDAYGGPSATEMAAAMEDAYGGAGGYGGSGDDGYGPSF